LDSGDLGLCLSGVVGEGEGVVENAFEKMYIKKKIRIRVILGTIGR